MEALADFKSFDKLKGFNKFVQRVGYAGLAIDALQLGSKIKKDQDVTSDYLRFGINVALTAITISNPIGLVALGAYAAFDYYYGDAFWKNTCIDN